MKKVANSAKVIAVANHKGGVGKTTTTLTTASILAKQGYKVLCVDLDAQANLTLSLLREDAEYDTIADAITQEKDLPIVNVFENFDIVPSSLSLTRLELALMGVMQREYVISDKLKPLKSKYDFIFLDCPPALGIFTVNALVAADYALITMTPEVLPYKGLGSLIITISQISERMNTKLSCAGILFTMYESGKTITKNIELAVKKVYGGLLFDTHIRKNVRVAEAPAERKSLLEYAPTSTAFIDYTNFTEELLNRINSKKSKGVKE